MNQFRDLFIAVYEPAMAQMGFRRKGKIFHRIVNQKVIQRLSYMTFSQGHSFTIQFSLDALCSDIDYADIMDEIRLGSVLDVKVGSDAIEWEKDGINDLAALQETLVLCQERLFPFFGTCNDYQEYFETMNTIFTIDGRGRRIGMPLLYSLVFDVNLALGNYELALKSKEALIQQNLSAFQNNYELALNPEVAIFKQNLSTIQSNYELALKIREALFQQNLTAFQRNWELNNGPFPNQLERFLARCKEYEMVQEALRTNNFEPIELYLKKNEEKTLASYVKCYYGKKALEKYKNAGELPF